MGFVFDDEFGFNDLQLWCQIEFFGINGQVFVLGLVMFYNGFVQEKLFSCEYMELVWVLQGGFDIDLVFGLRVVDYGWGLGYMFNQCGVNGFNLWIFGYGGFGGLFGFVDFEYWIGYVYVMNCFDVIKVNVDLCSVVLFNEVYVVFGVNCFQMVSYQVVRFDRLGIRKYCGF